MCYASSKYAFLGLCVSAYYNIIYIDVENTPVFLQRIKKECTWYIDRVLNSELPLANAMTSLICRIDRSRIDFYSIRAVHGTAVCLENFYLYFLCLLFLHDDQSFHGAISVCKPAALCLSIKPYYRYRTLEIFLRNRNSCAIGCFIHGRSNECQR